MTASPRLLSLATAVPPYRLCQEEVSALSGVAFGRNSVEFEWLQPIYVNSGIRTRYSCVPLDWYLQPHGWTERNQLYVTNAVKLLAEAASACLDKAGLEVEDVDAVVTVSSTGIATPSLDALLSEQLGFRRDVQRLPIFGLGCAGGVLGLSRAAALARALPDSKVLFLVVELCALTFRFGDRSKSNLVASALFGDGAAAALIGTDGDGISLRQSGEYTWRESLDVMGWLIEEDGFAVLFSRDIPALVRNDLRVAADTFLSRHGLSVSQLRGMVCHPGGAKVVDALENAFNLPPNTMREARAVLRDYGNMSAATVLFVLERMLNSGLHGLHLMSALGPGFTAGFQLLDSAEDDR